MHILAYMYTCINQHSLLFSLPSERDKKKILLCLNLAGGLQMLMAQMFA